MTKKQIVLWAAAIAVIGIASLLLSRIVRDFVLPAILKFLWTLKGYYNSFHQVDIWGIAIAIIIVSAGFALRIGTFRLGGRREQVDRFPGEVEQLSFWIRRAKRGIYPRWYLARTLADLSLELLRGQGANAERGEQLNGPEWNPPQDVQAYLEKALHSTPVTFASQLESAHVSSDPEAESIVKYLESYAENSND
jgi:hypothetical protein